MKEKPKTKQKKLVVDDRSLISGYLEHVTAKVDNCFNTPVLSTTVSWVIVVSFLVSFDATDKYRDYLSVLKALSSEKSSCMN